MRQSPANAVHGFGPVFRSVAWLPDTQSLPLEKAGATLQPSAPGRVVVAEELAVADVAADHSQAAMAGLAHDRAFGDAAGGGRGRQPGPQAVAGEAGRVEASAPGPALDDARDASIGQAPEAHAAGRVQAQEQWSAIVPGDDGAHVCESTLDGLHGARLGRGAVRHADRPALRFLIGLGAAQLDAHAAGCEFEILDVERDQLRAAERPGEAE
jgi:hypothetical protein